MFYKKYKSILSPQNGMNIYRGCTHGCIYCDSRSECYQINHEFADIEIKEDAPKLLDIELSNKRKPCMVGTGSMTDPYNHVEKEIKYTRQCLEVILKHHCGVGVLTKSDLILRDLDILDKINRDSKAVVPITLTTSDDELCKKIEPNVCPTSRRIEVLKKCQELGIPTVVWLCPFLPFINDTHDNITNLLDSCIKIGVKGIVFFGVGLTLRKGNREYFYECLDKDFPGIKEKYIKQFGTSYQINSPNHDVLKQIIIDKCRKNNIMIDINEVFSYMRKYPEPFEQLDLFSLNK